MGASMNALDIDAAGQNVLKGQVSLEHALTVGSKYKKKCRAMALG
jgi:hypothetical protein